MWSVGGEREEVREVEGSERAEVREVMWREGSERGEVREVMWSVGSERGEVRERSERGQKVKWSVVDEKWRVWLVVASQLYSRFQLYLFCLCRLLPCLQQSIHSV